MPFLTIHTNAKLKTNNIDEFLVAATDLIAEELNKPKNYIIVNLDNNKNMAFAGSSSNFGALIEIKSVGFANKSELAKILTEFLFDRLEGVSLTNINIDFGDMSASNVAIGGKILG